MYLSVSLSLLVFLSSSSLSVLSVASVLQHAQLCGEYHAYKSKSGYHGQNPPSAFRFLDFAPSPSFFAIFFAPFFGATSPTTLPSSASPPFFPSPSLAAVAAATPSLSLSLLPRSAAAAASLALLRSLALSDLTLRHALMWATAAVLMTGFLQCLQTV